MTQTRPWTVDQFMDQAQCRRRGVSASARTSSRRRSRRASAMHAGFPCRPQLAKLAAIRRRGRGGWRTRVPRLVETPSRRQLPGWPPTEHPPQPAGGPSRRMLGAVGSTRRRSARRRTGCVAAAPSAAYEAQDSRWLQHGAECVAWAAHGVPESPHEIPRPG